MRWPAGGIAGRVAAVVGVASLVAGLAATPGGARTPTPQQIRRACGSSLNVLFGGEPARAVPGAVPTSALAPYAVFRRPQAPTDVPPAPAPGTESLAGLLGGLRSYDPADTRLVATLGTTSVYLVAGVPPELNLPAKCRRVLPGYLLTILRIAARQVGQGASYCLLTATSGAARAAAESLATPGCFSFAGVSTGFQSGEAMLDGGGSSLELVPDGVGAVQFRAAGASPLTDTVQNNVATGVDAPAAPKLKREVAVALVKHRWGELRRLFNDGLPTSISWLTAPGGAVVRTFPRPPGLVDETVADLRASVELLDHATSQTCTASQAPGQPPKQHCTTQKNG